MVSGEAESRDCLANSPQLCSQVGRVLRRSPRALGQRRQCGQAVGHPHGGADPFGRGLIGGVLVGWGPSRALGKLRRISKLCDAATGELIHTFEGHSDPVRSVTFSPYGARVLSGNTDGTLKL